ncbi:pyridoxamine 5'-phosphate oxidase family protein [Nonomuraea sp. 10N515B]|uniref:pyridoxamine 5'-phosphate oxidase family protein n=1 Tax=Nonomuraea sp. 10N515B TaxID=3457422 RepID=UPI003FCED69B
MPRPSVGRKGLWSLFGGGRERPGTILNTHVAPSETVVAFEADELDGHERLGWSVIVTGVARLVTDPQETTRLKAMLLPWVAGDMDQVIRIRPEIVTGFMLVPAAAVPGAASG